MCTAQSTTITTRAAIEKLKSTLFLLLFNLSEWHSAIQDLQHGPFELELVILVADVQIESLAEQQLAEKLEELGEAADAAPVELEQLVKVDDVAPRLWIAGVDQLHAAIGDPVHEIALDGTMQIAADNIEELDRSQHKIKAFARLEQQCVVVAIDHIEHLIVGPRAIEWNEKLLQIRIVRRAVDSADRSRSPIVGMNAVVAVRRARTVPFKSRSIGRFVNNRHL